ncbi:DBIRD complex subunit ZNF326 [Latimeria chalumnae]|uniref:DBIRD complex subunit ZNF326 n=1 Tax=Latimeria chalumnae TaxID=7897 RepID=UPI0006D91C0A|nr:PREDICTED: DBIRD complex subunit ZNF326-like [Latimeria chalumnae]|eukprot:XP_014344944.1 PREDICTED: DBIRD complex subunit ZNF326-like [Latimeria chalumnae]
MNRSYGHDLFGGSESFDSYMSTSYGMKSNRFGPYESYDSRSALDGRDLYRSGYGFNEPEQSNFRGSYDDRFDSSYRNSLDSFGGRSQGGSSWDAPYTRSNMRLDFLDERGRDNYSSYSSFSSPHMKPASVGYRGRGMPAYPKGAFGGRSYDVLGGPSTGRSRGQGPRRGGFLRPGMVLDYNRLGAFAFATRGNKRKLLQGNRGGGNTGKKAKLGKPAAKTTNANTSAKNGTAQKANESQTVQLKDEDFTKDAYEVDGYQAFGGKSEQDEEEKKKTDAKREKQKRRREKNNEKYGDCYRLAFTCSYCKFRTLEEKEIEDHLESSAHQETLDYIQKQTKYDKVVMQFLHECMVNKYKKTVKRKQLSVQTEQVKTVEKDVMEGVTAEDHMAKAETVHCNACSTYIPAVHSSVQQHLQSASHAKNKQTYKEILRRESVLTATSILNNPVVKTRYEKYAKGENPFEVSEEPQEQQTEAENEPAMEEAANDKDENDGNDDQDENDGNYDQDENDNELNEEAATE